MERLASEPDVFKTTAGNAFVLRYVDDLLFLGEPTVVDELFANIQQHLLLRPTGDLTVGNTINFLGRNVANKGDYYGQIHNRPTTRSRHGKQQAITSTRNKGQQHRP